MNMFNIQYLKYNFLKIGISQVTIFVYIFIYKPIIFTTFPSPSPFFELLCVLMFYFLIFYWHLSIGLYFNCRSTYTMGIVIGAVKIIIATYKHTYLTNKETNLCCTFKIPYLMIYCDSVY